MPSRNDRQLALFPPERVEGQSVLIIGVGAIGRQAALQLSAAGVPKITLVDFDNVEVANMGPQGYAPSQIDSPKVDATKADCLRLCPEMTVETINGRFSATTPDHPIVLCCVDSIDTRKLIFETLKASEHPPLLFVDARMSAEAVRILTVDDFDNTDYSDSLFTSDEAYEAPCTARSTIYCSNIAGALMVSQISKYLRRMPLEYDFMFNILSLEIFQPKETAV
jgi:sulfur carrier protein ThiS adenylyltransferase